MAVLGSLTLSPPASAYATTTALHALGPGHTAQVIMIGLVPGLPSLVVATVVAIWAVALLAALLVQVGRALLPGGADASECFNEFFYDWLMTPAIAIITLTPAKRPPRRTAATKAKAAEPAPLPPVSAAATRRADETLYWVTFQSQATRPGGARDNVKLPGDPVSMPESVGRHARPEGARMPNSAARDSKGASASRTRKLVTAGRNLKA